MGEADDLGAERERGEREERAHGMIWHGLCLYMCKRQGFIVTCQSRLAACKVEGCRPITLPACPGGGAQEANPHPIPPYPLTRNQRTISPCWTRTSSGQ